MTWRGRMIQTMSEYYDGAKVTIYPWAHPLMTIVGLVYVFEDQRTPFLVYMAPSDGGTVIRIHQTEVTVENGRMGLRLHSFPDPDNDRVAKLDREGRFVVDPAPPPKPTTD